jgi:hypothetical protein
MEHAEPCDEVKPPITNAASLGLNGVKCQAGRSCIFFICFPHSERSAGMAPVCGVIGEALEGLLRVEWDSAKILRSSKRPR